MQGLEIRHRVVKPGAVQAAVEQELRAALFQSQPDGQHGIGIVLLHREHVGSLGGIAQGIKVPQHHIRVEPQSLGMPQPPVRRDDQRSLCYGSGQSRKIRRAENHAFSHYAHLLNFFIVPHPGTKGKRHIPSGGTYPVFRRDGMKKRDLLILLIAVVIALAVSVSVFASSALSTGSWGLSFRQEGAPPIGNAGKDQLRQYQAAYIGNVGEKVLYLTFDAGYENGCTAKILDTLKEKQVPAAFFLVGNYIRQSPDLVRRMVAEGHTVGNHTMHHYDMSRLSDKAAFSKELTDLEALYKETVGQELPKFYRPPQGIYSEENLKMAQELGYKTLFWSLAYVDWNNDAQPTREAAFAKLLPRTHNGAVVLLHSTSKTNAEILGELIDKWKAMGYRFGTLEELFSQ